MDSSILILSVVASLVLCSWRYRQVRRSFRRFGVRAAVTMNATRFLSRRAGHTAAKFFPTLQIDLRCDPLGDDGGRFPR